MVKVNYFNPYLVKVSTFNIDLSQKIKIKLKKLKNFQLLKKMVSDNADCG